MDYVRVLYTLGMTFSILRTSRAGPISVGAPREFERRAPTFPENIRVPSGGPRKSYGTRESATIIPTSIDLTSRSSPSTDNKTGMTASMIVVVCIVATLVVICFLFSIICLFRRKFRRHKAHQDPELQRGFGQRITLGAQQVISPPEAYHAQKSLGPLPLITSQSPGSLPIEKLGGFPPLVALAQAPDANTVQVTKPRRTPAPLLPRLSKSPALRLPGLPKSPRPQRHSGVEVILGHFPSHELR
ncbi:hypothetical protein BDZ94DRAFT_1030395 [Collybia nuda]|uniref:Uncharacterized protein n=1 Tax=Collybia nuda TaxID=64659 RepID=A0A9P5YDL3_9AGAR|nr:hypothetical protein BDZ94DRAFT_1030395 [Collybia nuda]